jgi:hypothetical protein
MKHFLTLHQFMRDCAPKGIGRVVTGRSPLLSPPTKAAETRARYGFEGFGVSGTTSKELSLSR